MELPPVLFMHVFLISNESSPVNCSMLTYSPSIQKAALSALSSGSSELPKGTISTFSAVLLGHMSSNVSSYSSLPFSSSGIKSYPFVTKAHSANEAKGSAIYFIFPRQGKARQGYSLNY